MLGHPWVNVLLREEGGGGEGGAVKADEVASQFWSASRGRKKNGGDL